MRIGLVWIVALAACGHDEPPVKKPTPQPPPDHAVLADLPPECVAYLKTLDVHAACDAVPEATRTSYRERKDKLADQLPRRLEAPLERQPAIDECVAERDKLVSREASCGDKPADKKPDAKTVVKGDPKCALPKGIPAECGEYCQGISDLMHCDKLPQASKDALQTAYETMSSMWTDYDSFPEEAKRALADSCTQARDAVRSVLEICK